jgi:CRP-like cAMP-binding protein
MKNDLSRAVIDFFMNIPLFEQINIEELKIIAKHMTVIELNKGDILFRERDKGHYMCFIVEGSLDVIKHSKSSEIVLANLNRGHSIGEMSVIEDKPRSATIKSCEKSKLFVLSKPAFDFILERHSKIGIKLLKGISCILSGHLRKTSASLAKYMI